MPCGYLVLGVKFLLIPLKRSGKVDDGDVGIGSGLDNPLLGMETPDLRGISCGDPDVFGNGKAAARDFTATANSSDERTSAARARRSARGTPA